MAEGDPDVLVQREADDPVIAPVERPGSNHDRHRDTTRPDGDYLHPQQLPVEFLSPLLAFIRRSHRVENCGAAAAGSGASMDQCSRTRQARSVGDKTRSAAESDVPVTRHPGVGQQIE